MRALEDDKMDAVIYDYPFANREIQRCQGKVKMVAFNLNTLAYSIGMPENNFDMLQAANTAIAGILPTAEYKELIKKYMGFDKKDVIVTPIAQNAKKYIVKVGESLSLIAKNELGDVSKWTKI